jgi:hypothetical protein
LWGEGSKILYGFNLTMVTTEDYNEKLSGFWPLSTLETTNENLYKVYITSRAMDLSFENTCFWARFEKNVKNCIFNNVKTHKANNPFWA